MSCNLRNILLFKNNNTPPITVKVAVTSPEVICTQPQLRTITSTITTNVLKRGILEQKDTTANKKMCFYDKIIKPVPVNNYQPRKHSSDDVLLDEEPTQDLIFTQNLGEDKENENYESDSQYNYASSDFKRIDHSIPASYSSIKEKSAPLKMNQNNSDTSNLTLELILKKLASLEVNVSEVQSDIIIIKNTGNDILSNFQTTDEGQVELPIKYNKDLIEINIKCEEPQYANYFKKIARSYRPTSTNTNSSYGISKIISEEIIKKYNWDGTQGKMAFKSLIHLNNVLYDSWKGSTIKTFEDYQLNVRGQFHSAKCRFNQQTYRAKKNTKNNYNYNL